MGFLETIIRRRAGSVRKLQSERPRQYHAAQSLREIPLVDFPNGLQVLREGLPNAIGQHDTPILLPLLDRAASREQSYGG